MAVKLLPHSGSSQTETQSRIRFIGMAQLVKTYNGLSLVFRLNWDLLMYIVAIGVSLVAGRYIGLLFI